MTRNTFFTWLMLATACIALAACGMETIDETGSMEPLVQTSDDELRALADRYLLERHETPEEGLRLLRQIQALSAENSYRFFNEVQRAQTSKADEPTDEEQLALEMSRAVNEYAREHRVNRLRLTRSEIDDALATHLGLSSDAFHDQSARSDSFRDGGVNGGSGSRLSCSIGYASCSTVTYTSTNYGGSCGSGCVQGYAYDRFSNEACEAGACDHRIFYPSVSLEPTVDGETSAADCVITHYGGIISRHSGGYTQLGYGIGGPDAVVQLESKHHTRINYLL